MSKRLCTVLVALLATAGVVAGCGEEEGQNTGDQSGAQPGGGAGGNASERDVRAAVERCKRSITASGQRVEPDVEAELKKVCEQAAEGDEEAVRRASRKVCERTIEDSVPAGPIREQALASCEQATRQP